MDKVSWMRQLLKLLMPCWMRWKNLALVRFFVQVRRKVGLGLTIAMANLFFMHLGPVFLDGCSCRSWRYESWALYYGRHGSNAPAMMIGFILNTY